MLQYLHVIMYYWKQKTSYHLLSLYVRNFQISTIANIGFSSPYNAQNCHQKYDRSVSCSCTLQWLACHADI